VSFPSVMVTASRLQTGNFVVKTVKGRRGVLYAAESSWHQQEIIRCGQDEIRAKVNAV
jgi:hypothetical protein